MKFGDKMKAERKKKGLAQKELGKKLGVSQAMIAQYENGERNPKVETIKKIAEALEVDISTLVDTDELAIMDIKEKPHKWGLNSSTQSNPENTNIMKNYNKLNTLGQKKAIEQVEMLTKIEEYTKKED